MLGSSSIRKILMTRLRSASHYLMGCTCSHSGYGPRPWSHPVPRTPGFRYPNGPATVPAAWLGLSLLWRETGYGVSQLSAGLAFVVNDAFRPAHLGQMGPVAVVDQF